LGRDIPEKILKEEDFSLLSGILIISGNLIEFFLDSLRFGIFFIFPLHPPYLLLF